MKDLNKVNGTQLFSFWKNLSYGLLVVAAVLVLSKVLPFYFSPIICLVAAAFLYTLLYNNKITSSSTCMVIPYAMFYCVISYAFLCIILNVMDLWTSISIPKELSFFSNPFIPGLMLDPVCFFVLILFYFRRNRLAICIDCKISKGLSLERGKLGEILSRESKLQLINLIWLFGVLSVVMWVYYFVWYYQNALVNNRDWYVFLWINVIFILLDEVYFASRYYNIYLDLKENGEIITEEELSDMTTKTYLRCYVICGDYVYLNPKVADPFSPNKFVIDTPFVTKRNVNGITTAEMVSSIQRLTGVKDGEFRFFFGRKSADIAKHRLLRYFYFLNGNKDDYNLDIDGEWMSFDKVKEIYNFAPQKMGRTLLIDLTRLLTIVLTQKLFDERGYRKIKIKSYQPSVTLPEVREQRFDFQDDKWIRISMYNSDIRSFQWHRWLDKFKRGFNRKNERQTWRGNQ